MKMKALFLFCTLLICQGLRADDCATCDWCYAPCARGAVQISGEALYWRACRPSLYYAMETALSGNIEDRRLRSVEPGYDWGFQVSATVGLWDDCTYLSGGWIFAQDTATRATGSAGIPDTSLLAPLLGDTPFIKIRGKLRDRYNRGMIRLSRFLYKGCRSRFYALAGINYVHLEEQQKIEAFGTNNARINQSLDFQGVAFEVAVGGEYHVLKGLSLVGTIGGLGGVGERKSKFSVTAPGILMGKDKIIDDIPSPTICFPGVETKVGIRFTADCFCVSFVGEIGYQLDYYFSVFDQNPLDIQEDLVLDTDPTAARITTNSGAGGPYVALRLRF